MKLGVLTLWTNGMSATPALAPRAPSKRGAVVLGDKVVGDKLVAEKVVDAVAPLAAAASRRASPIETAGTRAPRLDDVLAADAKPLFAVDDIAYAMPIKAAPSSARARRSVDAGGSAGAAKPKASAKPRRRSSARSHA